MDKHQQGFIHCLEMELGMKINNKKVADGVYPSVNTILGKSYQKSHHIEHLPQCGLCALIGGLCPRHKKK